MQLDVIFVGGGLSAGLGALMLLARDASTRVGVVEAAAEPGEGHTWCFHRDDVPPHLAHVIEPLVSRRWPGYDVHFPNSSRRLASPYACVTAARFARVLRSRIASARGSILLTGTRAKSVSASAVELEDGRTLHGPLVVDCRGPALDHRIRAAGFQKFFGLELRVASGHGLTLPVVMDARLPQRDGLHFMYALPFDRERLLLEDTYFAASAHLDEHACAQVIADYARSLGVKQFEVVRSERGVLPLPYEADLPVVGTSPIRGGFGGGYFHPVTGYSFPMAVRFADALSQSLRSDLPNSPLAQYARTLGSQLRFLHGMTRSMFEWFAPDMRYAPLQHFYRLPEPLIARFYAAELSAWDRLRMFVGRPPRGLSPLRMLHLRNEVSP